MATSTGPPAVTYEAESLAGGLRSLSHRVIEQELERLARKAPSLTGEELELVTGALYELVERVMILRASGLPHREVQLRHLFGLTGPA